MIIIEGPDGSGKTVLAQRLSKDLGGVSVYHAGAPPVSMEQTYKRVYMSTYLCTQQIIQDRSALISEPIYGKHLRAEGAHISWNEAKTLIKALEPLVVYCRPPTSELTPSKEDYDSDEYVKKLSENQHKIVYQYDTNLMEIDRG
jgi:Cdc6-like AAA superfamily ATPase